MKRTAAQNREQCLGHTKTSQYVFLFVTPLLTTPCAALVAFRNLANHLYAKVYETQEDLCLKRNEIRMANLQLASVRAQVGDGDVD